MSSGPSEASPPSERLTVVRKGGLEPPCLTAPPPQDGVSANSTTSARCNLPVIKTLAIFGRKNLLLPETHRDLNVIGFRNPPQREGVEPQKDSRRLLNPSRPANRILPASRVDPRRMAE